MAKQQARGKGKESQTKTQAQVLTRVSYDKKLPTHDALQYKRVRALRRDPTIALARWLSNAPIIKAQWSVESSDLAPAGAREIIEECILPMQFHVMRTAAYGCTDFGWQPYEKIFGKDKSGAIVLSKLKPLLQDFTDILVDKQTGAFAGLYNCIESREVWLDVSECLVLNFDVEGTDFYGQSILANVDGTQKNWENVNKSADRYDRKIAGSHWVIHYPDGQTLLNGTLTTNEEIARTLLNDLESSGSTAVPRPVIDATTEAAGLDYKDLEARGWKIDIIEPGNSPATAFIDRLKYLDVLKVRGFGMPERALIEGQFGTKAEAGEHADAGAINMQNRLDLILQDFNKYVVNQILLLNYGEDALNTVWVSAAPIDDMSIAFLRDVYKTIAATPDGFALESASIDLDALRDRLDIPSTVSALEDRDETEDTEQRAPLTGIQISSILNIAQRVAAQELSPDVAKAIIAESFPQISEESINAIVAG